MVLAALVAELNPKEVVLHVEIVFSRNFEFLGMVRDGTSGRLRDTARGAGACGVHSFRCCRCDSPLAMPSACSPALSVLEEIFPWSLEHLGHAVPLIHSFFGELRVARALLFVFGSNFWRDVIETVFCSGASSRECASSSLRTRWLALQRRKLDQILQRSHDVTDPEVVDVGLAPGQHNIFTTDRCACT